MTMCRILSYLGKPIIIEELLYKPDNSFIKQSYHPKYMSNLLNLAGFGLAAWDLWMNVIFEAHSLDRLNDLLYYTSNRYTLIVVK